MTRLLFIACVLATASMATPGLAFDWSGFYVGVSTAYSLSSTGEVQAPPDLANSLSIPPGAFDVSSASGVGVTLGVNQVVNGQFVVGIEGQFTLGALTTGNSDFSLD